MGNRVDTALYWTVWSLKVCDGLPIEQIAQRLERSPGEILDLLLHEPVKIKRGIGLPVTTLVASHKKI